MSYQFKWKDIKLEKTPEQNAIWHLFKHVLGYRTTPCDNRSDQQIKNEKVLWEERIKDKIGENVSDLRRDLINKKFPFEDFNYRRNANFDRDARTKLAKTYTDIANEIIKTEKNYYVYYSKKDDDKYKVSITYLDNNHFNVGLDEFQGNYYISTCFVRTHTSKNSFLISVAKTIADGTKNSCFLKNKIRNNVLSDCGLITNDDDIYWSIRKTSNDYEKYMRSNLSKCKNKEYKKLDNVFYYETSNLEQNITFTFKEYLALGIIYNTLNKKLKYQSGVDFLIKENFLDRINRILEIDNNDNSTNNYNHYTFSSSDDYLPKEQFIFTKEDDFEEFEHCLFLELIFTRRKFIGGNSILNEKQKEYLDFYTRIIEKINKLEMNY